MSGTVFYKNEALWRASSTRFDNLAEKLLSIAYKKSIDPHSTLVQFIKDLEYHTWGFIDKDLNSKKEVAQLAELLKLAIKEWVEEGYYNYYNYKENGEIKNVVLSEYKHFAQRLREIAAHEWKDENLYINRADTIDDIAPILFLFAQKKNLDPNSNFMKFLQRLSTRKAKDIEICTKEDLRQFIELAELSLQELIKNGYFKQYEIIENGQSFNYLLHNYLIYIERLKEVANDWDNAISDE